MTGDAFSIELLTRTAKAYQQNTTRVDEILACENNAELLALLESYEHADGAAPQP